MKNFLSSFALVVFLISFFLPVYGNDASLKIKAFPDQTSVKVGMMFKVEVQVLNNQHETVPFWGNTCSYEKQWVTDNPDVLIQPWTCEKNGLEKIVLTSGGIYKRSLLLYIPKKNKTEIVKFRLGFKSMTASGALAEPIWGDPLTMRVVVSQEGGNVSQVAGDTPKNSVISSGNTTQQAKIR